jgi:integrase
MPTVADQLATTALERGLRQSTIYGYERLFRMMGILNTQVDTITHEIVMEMLYNIDNPNTRRSAVIAIRSVLGLKIKIPRALPRRYDLPDEQTLRLALMLSPHEARGLLMAYAGLRIGEAYADRAADRLRVDKQVLELTRNGKTTWRIAPVKTQEAEIVIPHWLGSYVDSLHTTDRPARVRESLRRAGNKVGISLTPHMLRHWYATTLLARGVPLALVSRQMRHSDVATTLRTYQQYSDSDVHRALG